MKQQKLIQSTLFYRYKENSFLGPTKIISFLQFLALWYQNLELQSEYSLCPFGVHIKDCAVSCL